MAIPKAAPNDVFAYYFQYAVFVKGKENEVCRVFLDSYACDPAAPVRMEDSLWVSAEDCRRIYAPYLQVKDDNGIVSVTYGNPDFPELTIKPGFSLIRRENNVLYLALDSVMGQFGKTVWKAPGFTAVAVDAPAEAPVPFTGFAARMFYMNILGGKDRGEMNYVMWIEEANRLIPYRMYIPFSYDPAVPQKTLICFHGGDANADYMFNHTHGEIERYAERRGYILLALTSFRKFTFFGASRFPAGAEPFDPEKENPLGLTDEEWENSLIAERSVMTQIGDAAKRYNLDMSHLYAMGNSGGSLGIFRQVQAIGKPFFKGVACSGGVGSPWNIDYDLVRSTGTKFLIVMSSEDIFDGQFTGRVAMPIFRENGMDAELLVAGGGSHLTGWAGELEAIFTFFDSIL